MSEQSNVNEAHAEPDIHRQTLEEVKADSAGRSRVRYYEQGVPAHLEIPDQPPDLDPG